MVKFYNFNNCLHFVKITNMKILIVCQYYYPENFVITKIAEQMVKDGYEVHVLTGKPNYGYGYILPSYKNVKEENINEKVHFSMGILQDFAHEFIYDKHEYIDYTIMRNMVNDTIINLFS